MQKCTSIKVKLRASSVQGNPGTVVYQVTHNRVVRLITTGYRVYPQEWNEQSHSMRSVPFTQRGAICQNIAQGITCDLERLGKIVAKYENGGKEFTTEEIIATYNAGRSGSTSFFPFMQSVIVRLKQLNKIGTSNNYQTTFNSLRRFMGDDDLAIEAITSELMENYEAWLLSQGLVPNSTSFYMRILRAVYARAVEKGLVQDAKPFRKVYTGIEKTRKRAITIKEVKRIKELDLRAKPHLDFARNIFLFQFYCRGISFIDTAFLRKQDVQGDHILYRRHKTNQLISIALNDHIRSLLHSFGNYSSPYLLPIINRPGDNERRQYETALRRTNNALKEIGRLANVEATLTTYVCRHAWASIAKSRGVAISTISDALGHDNEKTTEIYLASIDSTELDRANDIVCKGL